MFHPGGQRQEGCHTGGVEVAKEKAENDAQAE